MAWVKRSWTKSGATAVQVFESMGGRRWLKAHVGSAHDEVEFGLLMARARELVANGQDTLGLDDADQVVKARLVDAPVRPAPALVPGPVPARPAPVFVSAGRVLQTSSVLLFDVIAGVYDGLGFSVVNDDVFRDLVVTQVVEPTSLLDVDRVLADLGRVSAHLSTRKRTLARCVKGEYRSLVSDACFNHSSTSGDMSLCLYDVTTLRTQAENQDDFRKPGYSKDRSVDPQIVVGLLVDRHGFPLEVACFEGNKAEKLTIIPVVKSFATRHAIASLVVAADAGMLSAANLKALDDAGISFIVGSRATKAPIDLESHFVWHGEFTIDGQIVDTVTPKIGRNGASSIDEAAEPVWGKNEHPSSWRAVWQYSAKRFGHDNQTLNLQQARVQAVIDGEQAAHKPRFVKRVGGRLALDQASLARARRVAGLKGYVTNMDATTMPAQEVIARYHDLWHVEQSFRITKSDLAARPFFARKRDAIEAHLTIVFTALAVSRTMQNRTGQSLRRIIRTLRPLRSATITINGVTTTLPPALTADAQDIIDKINAGD